MEQGKSVDSDESGLEQATAIPKTVGLRYLVGGAIVTPVVLAMGVLWLHSLPTGLASRSTDSVVEVRLIAQEPVEQQTQTSVQMASRSSAAPTDNLVEDPVRTIPKEQETTPAET